MIVGESGEIIEAMETILHRTDEITFSKREDGLFIALYKQGIKTTTMSDVGIEGLILRVKGRVDS